MTKLIDGPTDKLRGVYLEGLALSVAAILPSFVLMCWTDWSALTPMPMLIASIGLGGILWAALLWQRLHPIALEVARLLHRPR